MIKALFLTFKPGEGWERVAQARRGVGYILVAYLLPLLLLVTVVEGWGLVFWGKWQTTVGMIKIFTVGEAAVYETVQFLFTLAAVFICAYILKIVGETFRGRYTYTQTFTVAAYGLSPVFWLRLFDALPRLSPWITWCIGITLSIWVLYQGLPRVMLPDPGHVLGLCYVGSFLFFLTTGLVRLLTALYLQGGVDFAHSYIGTEIAHLLARLRF
jgi:hypothetical protein